MTYNCVNCGAESKRTCWTCQKHFDNPQDALVHHDGTGHEISIYVHGGYQVVPEKKYDKSEKGTATK